MHIDQAILHRIDKERQKTGSSRLSGEGRLDFQKKVF